MAYCRREGQDRITLVTREDRETPSNAELVADDPNDPYEEHGPILPNRDDINCNCPCLAGGGRWPAWGTVQGGLLPLPLQHRGCQGVGLCRPIQAMQECMQKYPDLYPQEDEKPVVGSKETAVSEAIATKEEGSS
ncbi:hypothetical protein EI555_006593 [Monodon monoceros]|uniref:CHCH domain-containing protein n=1 Tax=Monodon monoceros TaxID=40151 RepID=A0A4V5P8M7_MONMO|nr:hypothetical protein EI555_006593 [Monodon monoceros]